MTQDRQQATSNTHHVSRLTSHISRLVSRLLTVNPIVIKEMRAQMRGPRAFWILTGYLLGLGLLAYGLYRITLNSASQYYGPGAPPQSAFIGQTLFIGLAFLEMVFVCFITPALTAGAISGEAERLTSDVLLSTPLRAASIVFGKTFASLTYIQLLILATIPLSSVVFLFGGVALRDVVQVIGLLALTAITYGTMGIFFSALTRRTGRATALSYLVVMAIIFGSVFSWAITSTTGRGAPPRQIFYVNPFSALASAVMTPQISGGYYSSPVTSLLFLLGGGPEAMGFYTVNVPARPIWQYTTALYLAVTAILYLLTTQLIKPVRRWRIGWRGVIALVLVLAALAGGLWVVFGTAWGSTGWQGPGAPTEVPVVVPPMPAEVIVERVVEVTVEALPLPPPEPTPPPPPTPTPAAIPFFDVEEQRPFLEDLAVQSLAPEDYMLSEDAASFCDLDILEVAALHETSLQVSMWAYCRTYGTEDGQLAPGVGVSVPMIVLLSWRPDGVWGVDSYFISSAGDMLPPAVQQRLIETPYDEAAGEEQLRERARQALLGE